MHSSEAILNRDILKDSDIQPNGIDIRINKLYRVPNSMAYLLEDKRYIPPAEEITPWEHHPEEFRNCFYLHPGSVFEFETELKVKVPDNYIGIIHQRSTLSRAGVLVTSGIYDSGYEGLIAGQLHSWTPLYLERGVRIAQFILLPATSRGRYSGIYQNKTTSDVYNIFDESTNTVRAGTITTY